MVIFSNGTKSEIPSIHEQPAEDGRTSALAMVPYNDQTVTHSSRSTHGRGGATEMAVSRAIQKDLAERDTVLVVRGTLKVNAEDFASVMDCQDGTRRGIIVQDVEIIPKPKPAECTEHRGQEVDAEGRCSICGGFRTKVTVSDIGTTVWNWWNGK